MTTSSLSAMVSTAGVSHVQRKLRVLMLHSFRTSAEIFRLQMKRSGLDRQLEDMLEMIYIDAPFAATGPIPADVEPFFPAPDFQHREWWSFEKDEEGKSVYQGFDESVRFVEDALRTHAPVHGLCGFSQGAALAALLAANQERGTMLQGLAELQFCMFFGATLSRLPEHQAAYEESVSCPSIHIIGEKDTLKPYSERLAACFEDPVVIRHERGHVVPPLPVADIDRIRTMLQYVDVGAHVAATSNL